VQPSPPTWVPYLGFRGNHAGNLGLATGASVLTRLLTIRPHSLSVDTSVDTNALDTGVWVFASVFTRDRLQPAVTN